MPESFDEFTPREVASVLGGDPRRRGGHPVGPGQAKKRREHAAKQTRVERWSENSGNAGLAGHELPPAEVLAADQRVTAWAEELRKAGLDGGEDALRARAFLDILLGLDSRPPVGEPDRTQQAPMPGPGGPLAGVIPPGFAGHVTLTVPEATVTSHADRPGELAGIGPVDPDLARELAATAARNPRSTWCITVTDQHGHAVGHGCARPVRRRKPGGPSPPGFTFTRADHPGPLGGYGTWRLTTGHQDLLIKIGPLSTADCDHRHHVAVEIEKTRGDSRQRAFAFIGLRSHVDRDLQRVGEALEAAVVTAPLGDLIEAPLRLLDLLARARIRPGRRRRR